MSDHNKLIVVGNKKDNKDQMFGVKSFVDQPNPLFSVEKVENLGTRRKKAKRFFLKAAKNKNSEISK